MLFRPSFWILLLMAFGWCVYQVKYEVQQKETALARLNREIARTENETRILRAEWSHLNEPARLEQQNSAFLGLVPIAPQQILTLRKDEANNQLAQTQTAPDADKARFGVSHDLDRGALAHMLQSETNLPAGQNKGGLK